MRSSPETPISEYLDQHAPEDEPHCECGVFALYLPGQQASWDAYDALYALQHRGQESAGIASFDGDLMTTHRDMGLVSQVFNRENLSRLVGEFAIGHTRYSTTGSSTKENAQPIARRTRLGHVALAHNGNLTNKEELEAELFEWGVSRSSSTDSELAALFIGGASDTSWEESIEYFMDKAEGAYSFVILTEDAVFAGRDPRGIRPLILGQSAETGAVAVASESCALRTIEVSPVRDIRPGEVVKITSEGVETVLHKPAEQPALCEFEYVYIARKDSKIENRHVNEVRERMGEELAREAPADADIVIGVPDSAIDAAIGFSRGSGISYKEGFAKNRYIHRTFINPDSEGRQRNVERKLNPLPANLEGQRVVVVDDSIVRGNTSGPIVKMLRDAGAAEVHMRIASPPITNPCYMGVDMATREELIANQLSIEEIRERIGADSLAYLSYASLLTAIDKNRDEVCGACFTGEYPLAIKDRPAVRSSVDGRPPR